MAKRLPKLKIVPVTTRISGEPNAAPSQYNLQLRAANGEIVMQGTQGYTSLQDARRAARRVKDIMLAAMIEEPAK